MFTDVAKDSDFKTVPEGGCNRKCEYILSCGHSCTLKCHPYDSTHEKFNCKEPCARTCDKGHPCQKKCFIDCKPCPVMVEKVLTRCGHTVTAACGENESEIVCFEACRKFCKEGHPCAKKCFEICGFCEVMVEKKLSKCGHTVTAACGKNEHEITCFEECTKFCTKGHPCSKKCYENCGSCRVRVEKVLVKCGHKVTAHCGDEESKIKCFEACKEFCKEGHPCSRKCFENCESCETLVEKVLPECKHIVEAACSKPIQMIQCKNQCNKSCPNNHVCLKKCFEICGPCEVIIEKTLNCGHNTMACCGIEEKEIKCISACNRMLTCSHLCKNKCYEECEKKCEQLVATQSHVCGHSLKIECCFVQDSMELAKRCSEPCTENLYCGHMCKGTCSTCKQGNEHVVCNEACQKVLLCGHLCSNKCSETCVSDCKNKIQTSSSICGHLIKIECYLKNNLNELSKKCLNPCRRILPCGHTCKGSCGSCYQGRLHVPCRERCNRVLICGHKCEANCYISCPPCNKPCENKCLHKKCLKLCGDPCVPCNKPCNWTCNHKNCTRSCHEVCNRDPCSKRCSKLLPCNHRCIGFCGEPCPKECFQCEKNTLAENSSTKLNKNDFGYIYLEDCKHAVKEDDVRIWFTRNSSTLHEIKLKTCPKCGTIVRKNPRFNKIIKKCISDVEKIKQVTRYDKTQILATQRNLLIQINECQSNMNHLYKSVVKVLSGGRVTDIYELTNLKSIMIIAKTIEDLCHIFNDNITLTPFIETMLSYTRSCREYMISFIRNHFFIASEYQLQQLYTEVYRLNLLNFLVNIAKQKDSAFLSPTFEKCASILMTYKPLTRVNIDYFKRHLKNFRIKLNDVPKKYPYPQEIVTMSAQWYQCSRDHIICLSNSFVRVDKKDCYKCRIATNGENFLNVPLFANINVENQSEHLGLVTKEKSSNVNYPGASDVDIRRNEKQKKENKTTCSPAKLGVISKNCNASVVNNKNFSGKCSSDSHFVKKSCISNVPRGRYDKDRNNIEQSSSVSNCNFRKTSKAYATRGRTQKKSNENFSNPKSKFEKENTDVENS